MGLFNDLVKRLAPSVEQRAVSSEILPQTRSSAESSVGIGEAFSLPAVYRAISILTIATKQMSLDVVKNNEVVNAPAFIKKPNVDMPRSSFIEQTVVSLASQGNAYWMVDRDPQGKVLNLTPLNPLDMRMETNVNGKVTKYIYNGKDIATDSIKHLKLLQVPGKAEGLGPIQSAQHELRGTLDTRDYATTWFSKSGIPGGILKTDSIIDSSDATQLKDTWNQTAGAKNGVAVLGSGYTYQPVYLKPEEVQFLQVQQFSITQIARLFGVPASLMLAANEGTTMTYANVSQEWLGFVRFSLMQYLILIEDALTDFLPGSQRVKFNIEAILRADTTTRYAAHASALTAGWMTKNEVRTIEDLPERPEFETSTTPEPASTVDPTVVDPNANDNQGATNA
jgi:HK97 family phage portal protein